MPISLSEFEKRRLLLSSAQLGLRELCLRLGGLDGVCWPSAPYHWSEGRVVFRVEGVEFHSCVETLRMCGEGVWLGLLDKGKKVIFEADLDASIFSLVMDWVRL